MAHSGTPPTGDMRRAMRDAVKRSKGNKKSAQVAKERWKEQNKHVRAVRTKIALGVLAPLALLSLLYPLHTYGILRLWKPAALSKAMANPAQTQELDLTNQFLDKLPEGLDQMTSLKSLSVEANRITALDNSLAKLTKLEKLNLGYNPIKGSFSPLGKLTSLKELNMNHNELTEIPPEVFELKNLEVLHLKGNQITSLPADIKKLKKLRVLDLKDNQLANLSPEMKKLSQIEVLDLSSNPLAGVPDLSGYAKLKRVVLRNTGLRAVEIDALRKNIRKEASVNT